MNARAITRALEATGGNVAQAAVRLGVGRQNLQRYMAACGIPDEHKKVRERARKRFRLVD